MRALWSQIPRPRLGGYPSLSVNDPAAAILVRKTTTAPLRRRLTFNDAFTLLLTPVLATAFVVDTSWKEKQRKDWDKKLAEIQDEIDQFHARELRIRSSLQAQSVSSGLLRQRRYYSASAGPQIGRDDADGEENEDDIEAPYWLLDKSSHLENNMSTEEQASTIPSQPSNSEQIAPSDPEPAKSFSNRDLSAAHRYHRLMATTLAVRLITHFHVTTTSRLISEEDDMTANPGTTRQFADVKDVNWLVEMNQKLRAELRSLRLANLDLHGLGNQINESYQGSSLHMDILALTEDFNKRKLDAFEFVQGYARLILNSDQVPCTETYVSILQAVGRAGHDSLAYYVTGALKSSTLPLNDDAVFNMLLSFGKSRDAKQFENFLRRVIQSSSPHNVVGKWQLYKSKCGSIPVPENLNPHILQALIYMALRNNQFDRAEVWSSFLEEIDFASTSAQHLFSSFLHKYATLQHWDAGILWLRRCVHHATLIASTSIAGLSRVIFRMLDLCVACGRLPEYTTILDAAVKARIPLPKVLPRRQTFTPRARSILLEWESLTIPSTTPGLLSIRQRVLNFQEMCRLPESDTSTNPPRACQAPEDDLVIMAPDKDHVRYSVVRRGPTLSSTPSADSETTLSQLNDVQSMIKKHQAEIGSLKGQIEFARQAIHPLQQDLRRTRQRDVEQRELISHLQNQLAHSQAPSDRLHGEQKSKIEENALLIAQLESLPAALSSLKSMQEEIATLKASLQNVQLPRPSSIQKSSSQHHLAKEQNSPDQIVIRKQLAIEREDSTKRKHPKKEGRATKALAGDFKLRYQSREYSDPEGRPKAGARHLWNKQGPEKSCDSEYRNPSLQNVTEADHVQAQGRTHTPDIRSSIGDSFQPPKISRIGARKAVMTPIRHYEVQERPNSQHRGGPKPGEDYRLDLSNIGQAIPDVKNWPPTSKVGQDAVDDHVVIRRRYDS